MILAALAEMGIGFVTDLIMDNGEDLVKEGIKKVTGIDLDEKKPQELTPQDIQAIKDAELAIRKIDFKELQLELEAKKEANRHNEHYLNKQVEDASSAREMFKHGAGLQTTVAESIMVQTQWRIPLWIVLNIGMLVCAQYFDVDSTVVLAAGNLIGIALKSDYDERASVRNFLFGAMIAKVKKEK